MFLLIDWCPFSENYFYNTVKVGEFNQARKSDTIKKNSLYDKDYFPFPIAKIPYLYSDNSSKAFYSDFGAEI